MEDVTVAPEMLVSAAADVDQIRTAITDAHAAAAGPTTGLLSAAEDEVSAAIAKVFGTYGEEYQAVLRQAAAFHSQFTQALASAGSAYAQAEAAGAATLSNTLQELTAPFQSLLGGTATGGVGTAAGGPVVRALLTTGQQVALVIGGTFNPDPDLAYVNSVAQSYLYPRFPGLAAVLQQFTPEQFWPVTPNLGNLTFGTSVNQGVALLHNAILDQINNQNHSVVVFGYSQSATIVSNEIKNLMALGSPYVNDLSFVMIGDPNNPDGGLLSRFPGFYIPFLNVAFNGATPPNSPYPTYIYTAQYDGIANAPQYPLNVVSDLNAFLGYFFVHNTYPFLDPNTVANAIALPTSPNYTGATHYYELMTQNLPLVQLIRDIPYAGPPIADIFQPCLRVISDLGYGDLGTGFDYANVVTPASLFAIPNVPEIAVDLAKGAVMGPYAAGVEIGVEAGWWGPDAFPQAYPWVPSPDPHLHIDLGQPSVTNLGLLSGALGSVLGLIPAFS